jgi:hypothetical protein
MSLSLVSDWTQTYTFSLKPKCEGYQPRIAQGHANIPYRLLPC